MKKALWILIVLTIFSGCGSTKVWYKSNTTQEQFQKDYNECKMYGDAHCNVNPFMATHLTGSCMINKGYQLVSKQDIDINTPLIKKAP